MPFPKQKFKGVVTEIGRNAVLRSTGVSTAQTTSSGQEAKDFKVVVAMQDPPANLLPGLSATARITTARRGSVLAIPIQALTIRERGELVPEKARRVTQSRPQLRRAPMPKKSYRASSCSGTRKRPFLSRWRPASAARPTSK